MSRGAYRLYPRIPVQVSAVITTEDGVPNAVVTIDVSRDGLSFECDTMQRNMITPEGIFVRDGRLVFLFIDLDLNNGDGLPFKIVAKCRVVFSRLVSSNKCKVGLSFVDIESDTHEQLVQFITYAFKQTKA